MFDRLTALLDDSKDRDLAFLAGGMIGLMAGPKLTPLAMALRGMKGLEDRWREAHPEFSGGLQERFDLAVEFYDQTHQDPVNRALHTVGIPMILGGFVGMVASPRYTPPWLVSNGLWAAGWTLNFVGHGFFEKGPPAFAEDPLSFVAGPVWDVVRLKDRVKSALAGDTGVPADAHAPTA